MLQKQVFFCCHLNGGECHIPVHLHRRKRKTIGISVKSDLEIHIYWPERQPLSSLQTVIEGKRSWLEKHLGALAERQLQQKSHELPPGEGLWLLGNAVPIALPHHWTEEQKHNALAHCFEAMSGWFLTERFNAIHQSAQESLQMKFTVDFKGLKLRTAGTRWGSCTSKGSIMLNRRLFGAPVWVIDYVIWHELCHLVHLNHTQDFWRLCEAQYPKSQAARQWLRQHQELLLKQL